MPVVVALVVVLPAPRTVGVLLALVLTSAGVLRLVVVVVGASAFVTAFFFEVSGARSQACVTGPEAVALGTFEAVVEVASFGFAFAAVSIVTASIAKLVVAADFASTTAHDIFAVFLDDLGVSRAFADQSSALGEVAFLSDGAFFDLRAAATVLFGAFGTSGRAAVSSLHAAVLEVFAGSCSNTTTTSSKLSGVGSVFSFGLGDTTQCGVVFVQLAAKRARSLVSNGHIIGRDGNNGQ